MKKTLKLTMLSALLAGATVVYSCQKQDPAQEMTVKADARTQKADEDLVAAMSADEVMRAFVGANEEYLNTDEAYYNGLSEAGQAERRASKQAAYDNGTACPDPYRTAAQEEAFYKSQAQRVEQVKSRFPQLAHLSAEAQSDVMMRVIRKVLQGSSPAALASGGCHDGYNNCSWYCYSSGGAASCCKACRDGYDACMGTTHP